jgi:hypothetical protein
MHAAASLEDPSLQGILQGILPWHLDCIMRHVSSCSLLHKGRTCSAISLQQQTALTLTHNMCFGTPKSPKPSDRPAIYDSATAPVRLQQYNKRVKQGWPEYVLTPVAATQYLLNR